MTVVQRVGFRLFLNPHIYSGAVIARVVVCVATLLWGLLILFQSQEMLAVDRFASVKVFSGHVISVAVLAVTLAIFQMWETVAWRRQSLICDVASMAMTVLWTAIFISFFAYLSPLPPAGTASTGSVMFLAWWNFLVTPRR